MLFCPSSGANDEFQVVLGGVNIDKQEDMDQTIPVIRTIVHENYRDVRVAVYNDIGRSDCITHYLGVILFYLNCHPLLHTINIFDPASESGCFSS